MLWIPYTLLFIALLAFFWRTTQVWRLSHELDTMRTKLAEEGGVLQDTVNAIIQDVDMTLYFYRPVMYDRPAMETVALGDLVQDLRILSNFVGYGEAAGWEHAFGVLALYRIHLVVGRLVLSASASDEFEEGMDKLLAKLKVFEMLRGFHRTYIRKQGPHEVFAKPWPDLQVAQLQVASTQEEARKLLQLLEQDNWRVAPQS